MQDTTLFISDLHLHPQYPKTTEQFRYFLKNIANQAAALYILGDFFEMYIGDDDPDPWLASIQQMLYEFTQSGISVYFMHGNRDFLMGKKFFEKTGVMFIPDPCVIQIGNQSILLMHGDSLCTHDKNHQRFRIVARCTITQKLFLLLPLHIRKTIANAIREKSSLGNQYKPDEMMDVAETAVTKMMQKYGVNTLIHGHTHRPATHLFTLDGQPAKRMVLGAWHEKGNYLKWGRDGKYEWINF